MSNLEWTKEVLVKKSHKSAEVSPPLSGQEAAPVLSCARPVHRTGRLFVGMPFETPGDDMSQDVSYCRVHRSRTSPIAGPTGDGNPPVVLLR